MVISRLFRVMKSPCFLFWKNRIIGWLKFIENVKMPKTGIRVGKIIQKKTVSE